MIKKTLEKFSQKQFYLFSSIIFLIVLVCNIATLIIFWKSTFIFAKISSIAMMFFYLMLIALFVKMYNDLKKLETVKSLMTQVSEEDLDKLLGDDKNG